MRVMFKATLDTEKTNEVVRDGQMGELMKEIIDRIEPEAAYFGSLGGRRTALLFMELRDSSEMPRITEPFFTQLNAEIEIVPVMNVDELRQGLDRLPTVS